jgi:E3 ubiquitin-protein ligase SIS3
VFLVSYISVFVQVLVDMIRVPDWAFEAVGLEMRVGQDTAYHPGLYLTAAQVN